MIAVVDKDICLSGVGQELKDRFRSELTWPNPEYQKKLQMGKWLGRTPRYLTLVQETAAGFIIPFGMLGKLFREYPEIKFLPSAHLTDFKPVVSPVNVDQMGLYTYQEKAVKWALKARNGIIVAPCGSGKTQMGLAICGALGMRCLWLTHTHELLKQSMKRALSFLPIDSRDVGTITEGKVNAGRFVTFATVQTMANINLESLREYWDVIVVDECHKCVGTPTKMTMFYKVVSALSARFKFGLTATPKRSDGMQTAMFALLGDKFEIPRAEVKHTTCELRTQTIDTGWAPDEDEALNPDGTLNYVALISACVNDDSRNRIIVDSINNRMDGPVMVLSERIVHLENMARLCNKPYSILSTTSKSARSNAINDLIQGKISVLFATYQLAKEGLDIPCLRHLVMVSPVKDEITVTQAAGRVMRKCDNKDFGTVWDCMDEMRMLKGWHYKRMRIYGRLNDD